MINCKVYTDGQMKVYMLTIYIIDVECDNITLSHHLQLDVACNLFLVANYNHKLKLFLLMIHVFKNVNGNKFDK